MAVAQNDLHVRLPPPKSMDNMPLIEQALRKSAEPGASPVSERGERASFASFKEERSAVAQSFLDSKISSYAGCPEDAILDDESPSTESGEYSLNGNEVDEADYENLSHRELKLKLMELQQLQLQQKMIPPLTNPNSQLHGFVCPCDGFKGWKQIPVSGKLASRSFSDLKVLGHNFFSWNEKSKVQKKARRPSTYPAGDAPIERLPTELLGAIIDQLVLDIPPNGFQPRNVDLMSLLLTSRALHSATLATLYAQITIPHSNVFRKFLSHISEYPSLGTIVRRLDFSHFNPTGAGYTARQRAETQNLTPTTLLQCLDLLPNLREFLAQEHIDEELSGPVIRKLFNTPSLRALDFCAASSSSFRDSMMSVIRSPSSTDLPLVLPITRLSLHECTILPSVIYESILPRLPRLTHLDVTHTRITDKALASLPSTARLTHLNLSKCSTLSGPAVVKFLTTHESAKELVYLNLLMDAKSADLLDEQDISQLLPALPSTLKSLSLKGSKMCRSHIPMLMPLTKHLEELGLGRGLDYRAVAELLRAPEKPAQDSSSTSGAAAAKEQEEEQEQWIPHTLRYIDISDLEPADIDISQLFGRATTVLAPSTLPLEVIEIGPKVYEQFLNRERMFQNQGWVVREAGRRGWLVRDFSSSVVSIKETGGATGPASVSVQKKIADGGDGARATRDDGARGWKWGATYWGMRKVPVARQEVGGMYGLYMFKR